MENRHRSPAAIHAKGGTAAEIAAARLASDRATRHGPLGPINPPMLRIPYSARTAPAASSSMRPPLAPGAELRARLVVAGIAARYDVPIIARGERQITAPGAFAASLLGSVEARLGHFATLRIGRTADRTLRLTDTPTALRYAIDAESQAARGLRLVEQCNAGEFVGASVRFRLHAEDTREVSQNTFVIDRATLIEVSLVPRGDGPVDAGTTARLELACANCWKHGGLLGFVHLAADRVPRCGSCGMRHAR